MKKLSSQEKALSINLQPTIYGTFAEIGGGQEVANHFYHAGAASGTIAKTISAYDMNLSDSHYGNTKRYVSKERLNNMLNVEYEQLVLGLKAKVNASHYFVFASNVEITNYHGTNKGRGWMGLKFQTSPNGPVSKCILHFILHNNDPVEQKKIIGALGVNLIHSIYEYQGGDTCFVNSLTDNLRSGDIEINCLETSGPAFGSTTNRKLSLLLVKSSLTKMIMFGSDKEIVQPLNALHKRDVVLIRGRFNPPTKISIEMFSKSKAQVLKNVKRNKPDVMLIAEITFNCFEDQSELELEDLDCRIHMLSELGFTVMVTNFTYHSNFVDFLNEFTTISSLYLVLGLNNIRSVFLSKNNKGYNTEALRFIQSIIDSNYKILAFPELNNNGELLGIEHMQLDKASAILMSFLVEMNRIEDLENIDKELLLIRSENALKSMEANTPDWKEMVPSSLVGWLSERMSSGQSLIRN